MTGPHALLGVPRDADATVIRHAYARLVRQHRPDDDPLNFQLVTEAFESCLAHARDRERLIAQERKRTEIVSLTDNMEPAIIDVGEIGGSKEAGDGGQSLSHPPTSRRDIPEAVVAAQQPVFHLDAFLESLMAKALAGDTPALEQWLHSNEALYSLKLKDSLAVPLVRHLTALDPPMHIAELQALLRFFDLDKVSRRTAPLRAPIDALVARSQRACLDWRDLSFMNDRSRKTPPRQTESGGLGWHWIWLALR